MRFKIAVKFKTVTNFLHYKPTYNGHNAHAKRSVVDEYNPHLHVKIPPCVTKPALASAKLECRI